MPRSVLRVGTRGSALALAQAEKIRQAVAGVITHRNFELVPINTAGDQHDGPIPAAGGKEMFVRPLQEALVLGKIDLAVHSGVAIPATSVEGVVLAALAEREDPREALVTRSGVGLDALAPGALVGTSSATVAAQLLALRRGLVPTPVRGHLDARLRMLSDGAVGAMIAPVAGLKRLGRADRIAEVLPISTVLPAPGQGVLAVECRSNDKLMRPALEQLDDPLVRAAFEAERSFSLAIGGDRDVAVAALAEATASSVRLRGLVAAHDGSKALAEQLEGDDPEKVGIMLADRLREAGAESLIEEARAAAGRN